MISKIKKHTSLLQTFFDPTPSYSSFRRRMPQKTQKSIINLLPFYNYYLVLLQQKKV